MYLKIAIKKFFRWVFEDELKEFNKNLWTTQVWVQDLDKNIPPLKTC